MPISGTGARGTSSVLARSRALAGGFSLIEMLVVLFVIVLLTSLVSLNVNTGGPDRVTRQRLDALLAFAAFALDEAQESGSDFGLLFTLERDARGEAVIRAHWRQRLLEGWREPVSAGDAFETISFPPGVEVSLRLDGTLTALAEAEAADARDGRTPQWLFTASGETQTGELLLRDGVSGDALWRVSWDALGRFTVFRGDELEAEDAYATAS